MKLTNQSTKTELCTQVEVAHGFSQRLRGLIGTQNLTGRGLFIPRCNWIHTFFMSIPIDVIYVDGQGFVRKVDKHLKPWRLPCPVFSARDVIELPAGFTDQNQVNIGDQLYVGH